MMRHSGHWVSTLALATALSAHAAAQQAPVGPELAGKDAESAEIIVTGVITGASRAPSVAVSVLREAELRQFAPVSTADLLRNVPGIFVNSAIGEVRNIVYSRGISANSSEAAGGYYYVSLQEDGLPVTNVTGSNYVPDFFLRQDLTIGRVEALRGGTAVVTGPNAPGGIFNYISRNGKTSPGIEFSGRVGLLGDGRNPYYRGDAYVGGQIGKSDFYYSVGGFYRWDRGARDAGYAFNRGGQIKANLLWDYGDGQLTVFGKYEDDHNAFNEFLPANNFNDPKVIAPLSVNDSFLPPAVRYNYTPFAGAATRTYDSTGLVRSRSDNVGFRWNHDFGDGWSVENSFKYANNNAHYNTGAVIFSVPATDIVLNSFTNTLGPGLYTYRDRATGAIALQINRTAFATPGIVVVNNLPNQAVQANGVLSQVAFDIEPRASEFMNQGAITKKFETMTFRVGAFWAQSNYDRFSGSAGIGVSPIADQPQLFVITRTTAAGVVQQVTGPEGYAGVGQRLGGTQANLRQTQFSIFGGHNWDITSALSSDIGLRYERISVRGSTQITTANPNASNPAFGGNDGNPDTLFDNFQVGLSNPLAQSTKLDFLSFSGALTYRLSDTTAVFGRYSNGKKAPDLAFFETLTTAGAVANLRALPQKIEQFEFGLRHRSGGLTLLVNPFYSRLSNVSTQQLFTNPDGSTYVPAPLFSQQSTIGVEIEGNYDITRTLNLNTAITIQDSRSKGFQLYVANAPGPGDDTITSVPDGEADNNPKLIATSTLRFTPVKQFTSFVSWKYLGARQANRFNTFKLPGFSQFDLGASFNVTDAIQLSANVNNALNSKGVFSWSPAGGLLASLDRQALTPAARAANPNQTFNIITVQPRALFLGALVKF